MNLRRLKTKQPGAVFLLQAGCIFGEENKWVSESISSSIYAFTAEAKRDARKHLNEMCNSLLAALLRTKPIVLYLRYGAKNRPKMLRSAGYETQQSHTALNVQAAGMTIRLID